MHLTANPICQQDVRQCMWQSAGRCIAFIWLLSEHSSKKGLGLCFIPLIHGSSAKSPKTGQPLMGYTASHSTVKAGFHVLIPNFSLNFYKMKVAYFLGLQNTILSHHFVAQDVPGFACCIKGRGPCKRYKQTPIQPPSK